MNIELFIGLIVAIALGVWIGNNPTEARDSILEGVNQVYQKTAWIILILISGVILFFATYGENEFFSKLFATGIIIVWIFEGIKYFKSGGLGREIESLKKSKIIKLALLMLVVGLFLVGILFLGN